MKKLVATVAVLVIVLGGLVFALPLALGSDTLRSALSRQLSAAAGAGISLSGPVRFSVFPDFGIVAEDAAYASADGSVSVTAARMVASVRLSSLLSDRLRITGVELENPRIALSKAKNGEADVTAGDTEDTDVFVLAAAWLDRLSIDHLGIVNGDIVEDDGSGVRRLAGGIHLGLSVPGIDSPATLDFSGEVGGRRVDLAGQLGSLRDILARRPGEFSLSMKMEPPPHPAMSSVSATGEIRLAEDGSYRIGNGEIASAGLPMRFDASYVPGARPFLEAKIVAGVLDYGKLETASETVPAGEGGAERAGKGGAPDLSALRDIDVDFELRADAIRAGEAAAREVTVQTLLRGGRLQGTVVSRQIAGGQLELGVLADFNDARPEITGSLDVASVHIGELAALAGRDLPADGRVTTKLRYAFRGTDADAILDTINVSGVAAIEDGQAEVPQLADLAGAGAGRVAAIDLEAEISDIAKPLAVSGTLDWNGETVAVAASVGVVELLSREPGAVTVELRSRPVEARFEGTLASDGSANGRAAVEAASLGRLLAWLGGGAAGAPAGRFSYDGAFASRPGELVLDDATISLDDMKATGSATLRTSGKTAITAALSVDSLDFARLAGRAGEAGRAASGETSPAPIDFSALGGFDADISLDAVRLGYGRVEAGPARARLEVSDGIARVAVAETGFYDGSVTAEVTADGSGKVPSIKIEASLAEVDALRFLGDAAEFERIEGRLDSRISVGGSGQTTDALARSLEGEARVVFSDGAIRGIDVAKLVSNLKSLATSGYQERAEDRTEFAELSVGFDIAGGVARTDDLRLLGPLVRMDGTGSVDVGARSIDMRLNPRVVRSLDGQGGEFDVAGLGLPVIVEGPLSGPRIYPDFGNILGDPERALETISGLGGSIGVIANGTSGGSLKEALGERLGGAAGEAVTGVLGSLKSGGDVDAGTAAAEPDLVRTLLQNVLGQGGSANREGAEENQAALRQADGLSDLEEPQSDGPEEDAAPAAPGRGIVLPSGEVPVPTPDPRREAWAGSMPVHSADKTGDPAFPEEVTPETLQDDAADLIEGVIRQMGE